MTWSHPPQIFDEEGIAERELYARGFIISRTGALAPSHWIRQSVWNLEIQHDPRLNITLTDGPSTGVCCLGFAVDTRSPFESEREIFDRLVESPATTPASALEDIQHLSGRFLLLIRSGKVIIATVDATCMRSFFYTQTDDNVYGGSHPKLVANNMDEARLRHPIDYRYGYPGLRTPYHDISILTPNTVIELDSRNLRRYWAQRSILETRTDDILPFFLNKVRNSYVGHANKFRCIISLTAGLDSRATLAICGSDPQYFTYFDPSIRSLDLDRIMSVQIGAAKNLNHALIDRRDFKDIPKTYLDVLRKNCFYSHGRDVSWAYYSIFSEEKNLLHIRSNLSEIGRMFYKQASAPHDGRSLATLWSPLEKHHTDTHALAFEEFAEKTQFFKSSIELTSLFYWEHRMGCWHSQVVLESDPAFESTSLYNCRWILEMMLSVPESERRRSTLFKNVIRACDPDLLTVPVNGKPL